MARELSIFYHILLIGVSVLGALKFRKSGTSIKLLIIYLISTAVVENLAYVLALTIKHNLYVYHIYSPIQLSILAYYYQYSISSLRKTKAGLIISILGAILSFINAVLFQSPQKHFNSNILIFESTTIIALSLYYFLDYFKQDVKRAPLINIEFWLSCLLLFFWSATLLQWLLGDFIHGDFSETMYIIHQVVNIITYGGIGILIYSYKQLNDE